MKQLAGSYKLDEALLKQMWFQRSPNNVRQILSVSGNSVALDDLADIADKTVEIYPNSHSVNSVQAAERSDLGSTAMFQQQLTELPNQLASLKATIATVQIRRPRSPSRQRSFSRQRSQSPKQTFGICWYHQNYGAKARCRTWPCTFTTTTNDNLGNEPPRQY